MTINEVVLQKTAEWRHPGNGRKTLFLPDKGSGWAVFLHADRNDELGCLVWEVALRRTSPPAPSADGLKGWADRTAGRVTGLLDPLKVLEVDVQRQEALLRSAQATPRGGALIYYEVLLQGTGEVVLRRFQAPHDGNRRRQQIPFALTHEALAKVVADLAAD